MLRMARDEAQTWLEYDGDYYNNQMHNTLTMDSWDFLPNNEAIPSNQCGTYSAIPLNKSEFVENLWSLYGKPDIETSSQKKKSLIRSRQKVPNHQGHRDCGPPPQFH